MLSSSKHSGAFFNGLLALCPTAERVDLLSDATRLAALESPDPKTADVELARTVDDEIREWMGGNLCRCTGYAGIIRAIRAVATAGAASTAATGAPVGAADRGWARRAGTRRITELPHTGASWLPPIALTPPSDGS